MNPAVALAHDAYGTSETDRGTPLIILHGLFGSATNWRSIAKKLAQRLSIYALDLRNHGRSAHSPHMSYPAMAEDVRAFMDQNEVSQAHLLGHSMGGKTAMQLALETPDRVERLIVADIAPAPSASNYAAILDAMSEVELTGINTRAEADAAFAPYIKDAGMRTFLLQNLRQNSDGFAWRIGLHGIAHSQEALLDFAPPDTAFDGATLFLRGANSDYVRESDYPLISRYFTHATVETIAEAGHWLHAERPQEFVQHVNKFLD